MKAHDERRGDPELTLVGQIAAAVSCISFLIYLRHFDLLLYGDAVAHINIARRVFDSLTPGITQLGTVWLPLPHLAMLPFVISDRLWQSGIAGSIPSMAAYIIAGVGIFRLVRSGLCSTNPPDARARVSAWLATLIFAANPNLIYLQATAMTESLYLCFFVWSLVYFTEFVDAEQRATSASPSLTKCGLCIIAACFTRYDGWFLAAILGAAVLALTVRHRVGRLKVVKFLLLASAGPSLWLAYNAIFYRNPLEFLNGPYSAEAIERSSSAPWHPGTHNFLVAASYFLKAAQANVAQGNWGRLWLLALLGATALILLLERRLWPLLLLWAPLPFYALSIAYAGVPVYLPAWWPFTYYNVRYGVQLLPAFAVMAAVLIAFSLRLSTQARVRTIISASAILLVAVSYAFIWRAQPISFREASVNSRARIPFESAIASNLRLLPHDSTLIMYIGDHSGAIQDAGIPFRRVINEDNQRPWVKPIDPDGVWDRALKNPQQYADYVIAIDNDPVARLVHKQQLQSLVVIRSLHEPAAIFYWTKRAQR